MHEEDTEDLDSCLKATQDAFRLSGCLRDSLFLRLLLEHRPEQFQPVLACGLAEHDYPAAWLHQAPVTTSIRTCTEHTSSFRLQKVAQNYPSSATTATPMERSQSITINPSPYHRPPPTTHPSPPMRMHVDACNEGGLG